LPEDMRRSTIRSMLASGSGMLRIEVVESDRLTAGDEAAIIDLCRRAYEEELGRYLQDLEGGTHGMGYLEDRLVSHAMWVTRWLEPEGGPLLRTAYVELVATEPDAQRKGYASAVMRRLAEALGDFDLAALSPASEGIYARLGWERWRGPLAIRGPEGLIPTPDEEIMILRLPRTPPLDLNAPLSAEWRAVEELW
jgi:aminoglycoside 2'-N-acetyltransferase I